MSTYSLNSLAAETPYHGAAHYTDKLQQVYQNGLVGVAANKANNFSVSHLLDLEELPSRENCAMYANTAVVEANNNNTLHTNHNTAGSPPGQQPHHQLTPSSCAHNNGNPVTPEDDRKSGEPLGSGRHDHGTSSPHV